MIERLIDLAFDLVRFLVLVMMTAWLLAAIGAAGALTYRLVLWALHASF